MVVDGPWLGDVDLARAVLLDVCANWTQGKRVQVIATCGAFVRFDWPPAVPKQKNNRVSNETAVKELDRAARRHCGQLLGYGLRERLSQHADYLTIGIDTKKSKISPTHNYILLDHAELCYVADLRSGALHFTSQGNHTRPPHNKKDSAHH